MLHLQAHFYTPDANKLVEGVHKYRPVFTCVQFGHPDAEIVVNSEDVPELVSMVPRVRHVETELADNKLVVYGRNFGDRVEDLEVRVGGEVCEDVEVCHIVCRECASNLDCGDGFCIKFQVIFVWLCFVFFAPIRSFFRDLPGPFVSIFLGCPG
jgi:hypothetical protein